MSFSEVLAQANGPDAEERLKVARLSRESKHLLLQMARVGAARKVGGEQATVSPSNRHEVEAAQTDEFEALTGDGQEDFTQEYQIPRSQK